ncbi:hypothetical protein CVT26_001498 [Gymnopilus dilepis]|uniref:Uncharacterized protein n=1 Tax=Gymnopilus dilepis TaxID=231916 RepID=A0A409WEG9_9AGAR|nr:hypothetical protein CVT26_001498 [Gymnopilus dilepis]
MLSFIPPEPATLPPPGTLARRLVLAMDENTRLHRPSMWRWFNPRELVCPGDPNGQWFIINTDGLLFPVTARQLSGDLVASALFGRLDIACLDDWQQAIGYYTAYYNTRVRRFELEAEALNRAPPSYVPSEGSPSAATSDNVPLSEGGANAAFAPSGVAVGEASGAPAAAATSHANVDPVLPLPGSSPASSASPSSSLQNSPVPSDVSYCNRAFYDASFFEENTPRTWELTAGDYAPDDYIPDTFADDFVVHDDGPVPGPSTRPVGRVTRSATRRFGSGSNMDMDTGEEDGNGEDSGSEYVDDEAEDSDGDSDTTLSPYVDEDGDTVIPVNKGKKKARSKGKGAYKVVKRLKLNSTAATKITRWYLRQRIVVVVDPSSQESPAVSAPRSPTSSEITHVSATPEPEDARPFVPLFPEATNDVQPHEEQSPLSQLSPEPEVPTFRYLNTDDDTPFEANIILPPSPPPVENAVAGPSSAPALASQADSDPSSDALWDEDFTPSQLVIVDRELAAAKKKWVDSLKLD